MAVWFAVVLYGLATGAFWAGAATDPPVLLLLAILGPAIVAAVLYRLSSAFRDYVLSLDLRWLTAIQLWRVGGGSFIALNANGLLPGLFAYPAGYGDVFTGVFALFALMALLDRAPGWIARVTALNLIGLMDFLGAVATGVATGEGPLGIFRSEISGAALQHYPLSLIPTFLVPVWILAHLASLAQLARIRRGTAESGLPNLGVTA
jgi:hypothetical protein